MQGIRRFIYKPFRVKMSLVWRQFRKTRRAVGNANALQIGGSFLPERSQMSFPPCFLSSWVDALRLLNLWLDFSTILPRGKGHKDNQLELTTHPSSPPETHPEMDIPIISFTPKKEQTQTQDQSYSHGFSHPAKLQYQAVAEWDSMYRAEHPANTLPAASLDLSCWGEAGKGQPQPCGSSRASARCTAPAVSGSCAKARH